MTFHVGQKVVWVDDSDTDKYMKLQEFFNFVGDMDGLKKGEVYTVRWVGEWAGHPGVLSVWLVEIKRPIACDYSKRYGECPFAAERFRPVVERKTDISIFTAMLDSAPSRELADVS